MKLKLLFYKVGLAVPARRGDSARTKRHAGDSEPYLNWVLLLSLIFIGCSHDGRPEVVVYTSQDRVYSEPIFKRFTEETGIRVLPVYDNEAVKTVGLAQRLLVEQNKPRCDVFWSNEALRTYQLKTSGVLDDKVPIASFGYRSRRLVYSTEHFKEPPSGLNLLTLVEPQWKGKVVLAFPQFGTTAAFFLALKKHWGNSTWEKWCLSLNAGTPLLVDGNSVVVKMIAAGKAWIGLTDWDDVQAGKREKLPVESIAADDDTLLIPNTVCIIRNGPNPENAVQLYRYIQSSSVIQSLIEAHALEGESMSNCVRQYGFQADWESLVVDLSAGTDLLTELFAR